MKLGGHDPMIPTVSHSLGTLWAHNLMLFCRALYLQSLWMW